MILAIESSCDESALALFSEQDGICGEWVSTQIEAHRPFGGVVPGLAAREHLTNFFPLLEQLLKGTPRPLQNAPLARPEERVHRIVVTQGPGLAGCLALGISLAKALSLAWDKPLFGVNHLLGHVFSPFIPLFDAHFQENRQRYFPHLSLLVSGGNTLLISIDADNSIKVLAQTLDDAAGEALDKGAKLLHLPYPGGPEIERAATGDSSKYTFPVAFSETRELKFSFSGLKTSLRYFLEKLPPATIATEFPHICASYQQAVIDALTLKVKQCLTQHTFNSIGLCGGVSNNKALRSALKAIGDSHNIPTLTPFSQHTGDNATMIAFASYMAPEKLVPSQKFNLAFHPTLRLS